MDLPNAIMNLACKRTMSHFATTSDLKLYKEGYRDARHAAAELALEAEQSAHDWQQRALAAEAALADLQARVNAKYDEVVARKGQA